MERSYYLVDLPGYGFAQVSKSARRGFRRLIRDYLKHRESATGVVWLLDIRREPSEDDRELAQLLVDRQLPVLVAITKADKMGRGSRPQRVRTILEKVGVGEDQCVVTSAVKREGLEELREVIQELVSP